MLTERALRRYDQILTATRQRTSRLVVAAWDDLDSYAEEDIDRFAAATAPAFAGAKRRTVAASAATFALAFDARPLPVRADDVRVIPRIDHPFHATWHAVKEGRPNLEALAAGRSQAEAVAADFVQQTSRLTGDVVAAQAGVRPQWRRVPNADACEWCSDIAGQLYHTAASADFGHDRCYCMVVPVAGGEGQRVSRTYARGTGRRATGIRRRR